MKINKTNWLVKLMPTGFTSCCTLAQLTVGVKAMLALTTSVSRLITLFIGLSIFLTGTAFSQAEDSALTMVREFRLGKNLGDMSYKLSRVTITYQSIAMTVGRQKADELLEKELAISVSRYQDQWDRNLAKAWAPLMTKSEFDSLVADKQKSPYIAKFSSLQKHAGAAMKTSSMDLLTKVMTEALTKALEKSTGQK